MYVKKTHTPKEKKAKQKQDWLLMRMKNSAHNSVHNFLSTVPFLWGKDWFLSLVVPELRFRVWSRKLGMNYLYCSISRRFGGNLLKSLESFELELPYSIWSSFIKHVFKMIHEHKPLSAYWLWISCLLALPRSDLKNMRCRELPASHF